MTSSLKLLRPEDVWQPRMGAPRRNRNRWVHGDQTREVKELRRLMARWRRETADLLARAAAELAGFSPLAGKGDRPRGALQARACSRNGLTPSVSRCRARHLPRCAGEE